MTPIQQDKFNPHSDDPELAGNCMQAAMASILDLPLDQVPHFACETDDIDGEDARGLQAWWRSIERFVVQHRFRIVVTNEPLFGTYGIMTGRSPRGNWLHCVIAEGSEVVHDPHPDNTGVLDPDEWWYLVPTDPSPYRRTS